jgi:ribosomal protein L37AE/L43A
VARTACCPSCGAPVEFKSVVSVLAVCDYCQSTLVRRGEEFENLGKMAELIEDRSPLQRGAEGRWQGVHFALIGRIQLKYAQGLWNEWHLLFDNGKSGWLSEAGGEYVLSVPMRVADALPALADVSIGQGYVIAGRSFAVTNILRAECVAGEGELPFKVGAGYAAPVVDLRDEQGGFATFDYSDNVERPLVFVGESVEFKTLGWANLREKIPIPEITVKARAFNCPSCGATLSVSHEKIESVGCGSCGAVLDTSHETVALLAKASVAVRQPRLPLGSRGTLRGEAVEIIGYMRRCMFADGATYCWGEYVCLGPDNKLIWLTEYEGHWNLARVETRAVNAKADFKHFQSYEARVEYVIGEFPWRVAIDETAKVDDYVKAPVMLSRERTRDEQTWTRAEYIEPAEVEAGFGLKAPLPKPVGVFANQPNPHETRHRAVCRSFWQFAAVALAVHLLILMAGPGTTLLKKKVLFTASAEDALLTPEFRVPGDTPRLEVSNETTAHNNWVGMGITLVNKDTGQAWQANREISRYSGIDGGEVWTEGSTGDEFDFGDVPPGNYVLAIDHDMDPNGGAIESELKVSRSGPRWSSLILAWLALLPFPLITRYFHARFEKKRWAESDHPIVSEDDDD